ncbi:MAG TPA: 50S ribosomal protein L9 [Rhodospirillaceae bacterium]|nr:50S ribosomal protein L9 [Rhodospirillaceae bacterium]
MAQTQVILLERIESLGKMGDTVTVKPGYARNYLLPQKKALRATKENIAYFEGQRKQLEAQNDKLKKEAEKLAKKLDGMKIPLIRQASESGHLFGSVTARDIATGASEVSKETIVREMVRLNQNFKFIGLFPVDIALHPEVKVSVTINVARTTEEAEIQAKTGKALIADSKAAKDEGEQAQETQEEAALEGVLEEGALEAEKEKKAAKKAKKKAEEEAAASEEAAGE